MDPHGYFAAQNGVAFQPARQPGQDGYSPLRDELAELQRRLRARYGRRRVFRTTDVETVIRDIRYGETGLPTQLFGVPRTVVRPRRSPVPMVDLTETDVVIE